jgi:hypothetical protein
MKQDLPQTNTTRNMLVAALLVLALAAMGYTVWSRFAAAGGKSGNYFLDLNTGKIFVGPESAWAPIVTPSGPHEDEPAGVRVFLFSCAECGDLDGRTLDEAKTLGATALWVEKYTAEAKKALEGGDRSPETIMNGLVMRAPTTGRWMSPSSPEGVSIRNTVAKFCSGRAAKPCTPR